MISAPRNLNLPLDPRFGDATVMAMSSVDRPTTGGPTDPDPASLEALEGILGCVCHRRDQAREATACAAAAVTLDQPYRVTDLARAAGVPARRFRRMLDNAPLEDQALRRQLVAAARLNEIRLFQLEAVEVELGGRYWDVAWVEAVGDDWTLPLGWRRAICPDQEGEFGLGAIVNTELELVRGLLGDLLADYEAVEPAQAVRVPPLVACDPRFGEGIRVRREIGGRVAEYALGIGVSYRDHRLVRDPYSPRDPDLPAEVFFTETPSGQLAGPPVPVERRDGPRGTEYIAPVAGEEPPRLVVCRPSLALPTGSMAGTQREERARTLANIVSEVEPGRAASSVGADCFQHADDRGWGRLCILGSLLHGVRTGRLGGGEIMRKRP
jgi:hypothetical protein